ncbi:MAG: SMP-30/gluconolactonase/LRE family protein [Thermoanaerobaculia bacterium]
MKILIAAAILLLASGAGAQSLETAYEGGVFTEGPTAAPDGSIYFSDITASSKSKYAGHILRFDPKTKATTVFRSPSGMANGLTFDPKGRLVAAEGADRGGRRVTRTDLATGKSEVLADAFGGKPLNSPNDITTDSKSRVYFTDPRYVGREPVEQPLMGVYRIDDDGSIDLIVSDAGKPNGLAISPDEKTLYVAATGEPPYFILAYDLSPAGKATNRRTFVAFGDKTYADGLTVDNQGNVYCGCGTAGVLVFDAAGKQLREIKTPFPATNVEVTRDWIYVTAGGALYRAPRR